MLSIVKEMGTGAQGTVGLTKILQQKLNHSFINLILMTQVPFYSPPSS